MKSLTESILGDHTTSIQKATGIMEDLNSLRDLIEDFHQEILSVLSRKPSNKIDDSCFKKDTTLGGMIYTAYAFEGSSSGLYKSIKNCFEKILKKHNNLKYGELTYVIWSDQQTLLYRPLSEYGDPMNQTILYQHRYRSNLILDCDKEVGWPYDKFIRILKKK